MRSGVSKVECTFHKGQVPPNFENGKVPDEKRFETLPALSTRSMKNGTPRAPVEAALAAGRDVIFDIDWQGTQQLAQKARTDLVSVFVLPPTVEALEQRLRARAQDSDAVIAGRMAKAADEMSHWPEYDYVVVNRDLEASIAQVQAILVAERLRRSRQTGLPDFVRSLQARL